MANSRVGQYRLEFELTGFANPVRSHVHGLWVAPAAPPASGTPTTGIDIQLKGGGTKTLQEVANQYGGFLRRWYPGGIDMENFTLWRYVTEFQRDFVAAGAAVFSASPTGGTVQDAQQQTLTFRHANGGIGKLVFLEAARPGNGSFNLVPSATGDDTSRLAQYLLSVDSPMVALDNSFPVAALKDSRGENEKLFRKLYRG